MTKTARPVIKNAQDYNKTAQNITVLTPVYNKNAQKNNRTQFAALTIGMMECWNDGMMQGIIVDSIRNPEGMG
jgi:hypothetical protein